MEICTYQLNSHTVETSQMVYSVNGMLLADSSVQSGAARSPFIFSLSVNLLYRPRIASDVSHYLEETSSAEGRFLYKKTGLRDVPTIEAWDATVSKSYHLTLV
jgi:hypothetical protein